MYHAGETSLFDCLCTTPQEENRVGYIVFTNESGDILQSTLTTSGACRTSLFGANYKFADNLINSTGNASFSLNADGTDVPLNWGDVADVTSDNWTTEAFHVTDCFIDDVTASQEIEVGGTSSVKFKVKDGVTGQGLVYASCVVDAYDVDGNPLIFEPANGFKYTSSEGEVGFTHELTENFWETHTTYLFEFHCFSLPDDGQDRLAYLDTTGTAVGLKSCSTKVLFTTNGVDLRVGNFETYYYRTAIFFALFILILILIIFIFKYEEFASSFVFGTIAFTLELILSSMIFMGFEPFVLIGLSLPFDLNWALGLLLALMSIFTAWISLEQFRKYKEKQMEEEKMLKQERENE